jgi:PAS domain S-box-containing protein
MTFESERERLELAVASSQLGLWDWNMVTSATVFNERWAEIIGYSLEELQPTTIQTWVDFCHPDDLERSNHAIRALVDGEADFYDLELRMRHRDGHWIWVHDRGKVVEWAKDGTPLRMA